MTSPVGPPATRSLRRAGKKFRWSLLPDRPVNTNSPVAVVVGLLVLLEVVLVMPTLGLIRFAIYHARLRRIRQREFGNGADVNSTSLRGGGG